MRMRAVSVVWGCSVALLDVAMALSPSAELLAAARAAPLYVTSGGAELERLASAAEISSPAPSWPRDADALCGRWRLLATTETRSAGPLLPRIASGPPAVGDVSVSQRIAVDRGRLRCEEYLTVVRPDGSLLSAWTLLPPGGRSTLTTRQRARVVEAEPLRLAVSVDALEIDADRGPGTTPSMLAPALPIVLPVAPSTFDVTYLDERIRVSRDAPRFGGQQTLRIYEREDEPPA